MALRVSSYGFRASRWALLAGLLGAAPLCGGEDILRLPIGDPARRGKDVAVVCDGITNTATGEVIAPAALPDALAAVRVLFVGESHTDMETHRIELRVVEELARAGRRVFVGLEMYPYTEQRFLDQWSAGELSEAAFLDASRWYKNWGYHWNYYREIFLFAQKNRLRMFAINTPREVVAAVRKKGFQGLTDEERAHIPAKIETDNAEHLRLFKASFTDDSFHAGMNEEDWKSMENAQCAWDATMGYNAVQALQQFGDEKTIMVVLIGAGHVQYGLGAERQAKGAFSGKMASLLAVPVTDEKRGRVDAVNGAYASFVWGIPAETDPLYPSLGLATRASEADGGLLSVLDAEKGSPAARAGVAAKDLLVSFDGVPVKDRESLALLTAGKRWGDAATLVVRRAGQDLALTVFFRREPRAPATPAPSASRGTP